MWSAGNGQRNEAAGTLSVHLRSVHLDYPDTRHTRVHNISTVEQKGIDHGYSEQCAEGSTASHRRDAR